MPFTGKSRGKFCVVEDFYVNNTRDEEVSLTQIIWRLTALGIFDDSIQN